MPPRASLLPKYTQVFKLGMTVLDAEDHTQVDTI